MAKGLVSHSCVVPGTKSSAHRPLPKGAAVALGRAVRQRRQERGLTQEGLAVAGDVSVQMVRRLEAGTANPTLGTLHAITQALEVSWSELLVEVDER